MYRERDDPVFHIVGNSGVIRTRAGHVNEIECRLMLLCASVEDELVGRQAGIGTRTGHVVCWAADDEVAEELLALKEGAVVGVQRVELIQAIEEILSSVRK